ncbi:hypothetical protein [Nostoc sp. 106C]|jgi:hypothetical protein|uniref:hypothetical protein n=1 Tax=Nostoc sp. 106C TaxID=1932667 RepID=UPI000A3B5D3D|nr:hypothetical protein [Nostoc sp. 106C]OUL30167.1 hypothetical protein BV378_04765 [Nostoc sp. RF31YmG]OUL34579.1 hypothetical protein BV375_04305 [Nostoc sp. 106C]
MTDRRRSDDYKQISGYIPLDLALEFKSICARLGISQSDVIEEMTQEWVAKKTGSHSPNSQKDAPKTIADLVRANIAELKRCGIKNLPALAKGEVLPTPGDFAIITSALDISEEERKKIWEETFKISVYHDAKGVKVYKDSGGVKEDECEYS